MCETIPSLTISYARIGRRIGVGLLAFAVICGFLKWDSRDPPLWQVMTTTPAKFAGFCDEGRELVLVDTSSGAPKIVTYDISSGTQLERVDLPATVGNLNYAFISSDGSWLAFSDASRLQVTLLYRSCKNGISRGEFQVVHTAVAHGGKFSYNLQWFTYVEGKQIVIFDLTAREVADRVPHDSDRFFPLAKPSQWLLSLGVNNRPCTGYVYHRDADEFLPVGKFTPEGRINPRAIPIIQQNSHVGRYWRVDREGNCLAIQFVHDRWGPIRFVVQRVFGRNPRRFPWLWPSYKDEDYRTTVAWVNAEEQSDLLDNCRVRQRSTFLQVMATSLH